MALSPTSSRGAAGAGGGSVTLIQTITNVGTAAFNFTAIPQTYNDLILVGMLRGAVAATVETANIMFNGDATAANYEAQAIQGNGTGSASASAAAAQGVFAATPAASSTANFYAAIECVITGYSSGSWFKTWLCTNFGDSTATRLRVDSGMWKAAAAINAVNIFGTSANWLAGSQMRLYGRL